MASEREYGCTLPIELWTAMGRIFEDMEGISVYRDKVVLEGFSLSEARALYPAFCAVCKENGWNGESEFTGRGYPVPVEIHVMRYGQWGTPIENLWMDVLIGNWNC